MEYKAKIYREKRTSIRMKIEESGILSIHVPYHMTNDEIEREINKHRAWIDKHMKKVSNTRSMNQTTKKYSDKEIQEMKKITLNKITPMLKRYANIIGVTYGRVSIRSQKTRWGSCSSKGNLNYNCLLSQVPVEAMEYVVVHELCHRKQMNHSKQFWNLVEQILPDYKIRKQWLKEHGHELICRLK